jgi:N-acetylneuraminic acid mutarotase
MQTFDYLLETGYDIYYGIGEIVKMEPPEATFRDTLSIYYKNIDQKNLKVRFDLEFNAVVISQSGNILKVKVPDWLAESRCQVKILSENYDVVASSSAPFILKQPVITGFSPDHGSNEHSFEIYGNYFCPVKEHNSITAGGYFTAIKAAKANKISAIIPNIPNGIYSIKYKVADYEIEVTNNYSQTSTWTIIGERPENSAGDDGTLFLAADGRIYNIGGVDQDYYYVSKGGYFDISSKTWHQIPDFPGGKRIWMSGFAYDHKIYAGLGYDMNWTTYSNFYIYNPASDAWTTGPSFPGITRDHLFSFVIGDKAYLGGGYSWADTSNFYEYDLSSNQWEKIAGLPIVGSLVSSTVINNKAYLIFYYSDHIWIFDPTTREFSTKSYPKTDNQFFVSNIFSIDEKIYAVVGVTTDYVTYELWVYNTLDDSWRHLPDFLFSNPNVYWVNYHSTSFEAKGYMLINSSSDLENRKFMEYDPSKEP